MLYDNWKKFIQRYEWLVVTILLIVGFAVRLWNIGGVPYGLNQDEASAGYDAWAILNYGIDRCGNHLPVLLESWGSGQNILMSLLCMPFIAILGLTETAVRLPNAIMGCLTLVFFWLTARKLRGVGFGLCALFILAINPWHIMASRWALESNQLPFWLMLGFWFAVVAQEKPRMILGAGISFGLSIYAYGTAFFFLPLFLVLALIYMHRKLEAAPTAVSALVFIIIALPIALCQLINMLGWDEVTVLGITLTKLTESRQSATSVFGGGGMEALWDNIVSAAKMLWYQSDRLVYNSMGILKGGIFYVFGLPTVVIGLVYSIAKCKNAPGEGIMGIALLCALVCAALINGNINRINMLWLPVIYFSALGCYIILCKLKSAAIVPLAAILVCFCILTANYGKTFGNKGNSNYFPGLGEAIQCAVEQTDGDIFITNYVNAPYIFALFYTQTEPQTFIDTVDYPFPDAAFRPVNGFKGFNFDSPYGCDIMVVGYWETFDQPIIARYGYFCVCPVPEM